MHNEVIQSLWIGNRLSNNELLCLKSFIHHRHEFHIYVYEDIVNIPRDANLKVKDANAIIPGTSIFRDRANSYASFADWFRVKLLFQEGGWWVDTDTVCVRPFDIAEEYCFTKELHYDKQTEEVNNTYIKAPPGSWFLQMLLQCIEKKIYGSDGVTWGEVGIHLFRETLGQHPEMMKYAREASAFCPVNYFNLSELICDGDFTPGDKTFAIHLWNEIWRRGHLDKDATYHPNSLYERLKRTYLHSV